MADLVSLISPPPSSRLQTYLLLLAFTRNSSANKNHQPNSNTSSTWLERTEKFISSISIFFPQSSDILTEIACEPQHTCVRDQYIFKALTAQWLGETTQISFPGNSTNVMDILFKYLDSSASAAAQQCTGSTNKQTNLCGSSWTNSTFDGRTGLEQQLAALNVIVANLAKNTSAGASANKTTGGAPSSGSSGTAAPSPSKSSFAATGVEPVLMRTAGWLWMVAMATVLGMSL